MSFQAILQEDNIPSAGESGKYMTIKSESDTIH